MPKKKATKKKAKKKVAMKTRPSRPNRRIGGDGCGRPVLAPMPKILPKNLNPPDTQNDGHILDTLQDLYSELHSHFIAEEMSLEQKKAQIINLEAEVERLKQSLSSYGDHNENCAWLEVAESGRIVQGGESEYCDCGWTEAKPDAST